MPMQDKDEQLIKKMAKLLQEGATMLDKVCPECNTLIYRLPNKMIICPSCNREIIIQKQNSSHDRIPSQEKPITHNFSVIKDIVFSKIELLGQTLHSERDIYQVEKLITILEKTLQLYERLSNLHNQPQGR